MKSNQIRQWDKTFDGQGVTAEVARARARIEIAAQLSDLNSNLKLLVLAVAILICFVATAHGQQAVSIAVPAYSTARVDALMHAIGDAEGFGVKGAKPTRLNNPGDLKQVDTYIHFRTKAEGWAALRAQLVRIIAGQSKHYTLDMTIQQMGVRYAGSRVWARNVARSLNVSPSTKLADFLCNGDLDVPPQVQFTAVNLEF